MLSLKLLLFYRIAMKNSINAIDCEMIECSPGCILHSADCGYEWGGMKSVVIDENEPLSNYIEITNEDSFMYLMAKFGETMALFLHPTASSFIS